MGVLCARSARPFPLGCQDSAWGRGARCGRPDPGFLETAPAVGSARLAGGFLGGPDGGGRLPKLHAAPASAVREPTENTLCRHALSEPPRGTSRRKCLAFALPPFPKHYSKASPAVHHLLVDLGFCPEPSAAAAAQGSWDAAHVLAHRLMGQHCAPECSPRLSFGAPPVGGGAAAVVL